MTLVCKRIDDIHSYIKHYLLRQRKHSILDFITICVNHSITWSLAKRLFETTRAFFSLRFKSNDFVLTKDHLALILFLHGVMTNLDSLDALLTRIHMLY